MHAASIVEAVPTHQGDDMNKLLQPVLALIALALPGLASAQYTPSFPPVLISSPATVPGNPFMQYMPGPVASPVPVVPALPAFPTLPGLPALPALPDIAIPGLGYNPLTLFAPSTLGPVKPYTMRKSIPPEAKRQMMQMMMPIMTNIFRMSMPDAMSWMSHKYKAKPGLSFDDVLESMNLRANKLNFKYVGSNLMWKDFKAVLNDQDSPRIEVHSYCDIAVGRDLLKISPEFLVFLPCRIGVMEDANKDIWVMMLDWNLDWVGGYESAMGVTPELAKGAKEIRDKMDDIMRAGANGDL
jgi:uncharacterized protein (DUF302 family)